MGQRQEAHHPKVEAQGRYVVTFSPPPSQNNPNCRTDLIAIILSTTEFKQVSKSDIKEIIKKVFQSLSSLFLYL